MQNNYFLSGKKKNQRNDYDRRSPIRDIESKKETPMTGVLSEEEGFEDAATTIISPATDDIYDFVDDLVSGKAMGNNATVPATIVDDPAKYSKILVLIGNSATEFTVAKNAMPNVFASNAIFVEMKGTLTTTSVYIDGTKLKTMKSQGLIISMPINHTCFCTQCLGTFPENDVEEHVKKCFSKVAFSTIYCAICAAKVTHETALPHYTSKSHEKREALFRNLKKHDLKYYVAMNGVATDNKSALLKNKLYFEVDPMANDRLQSNDLNVLTYTKTEEQRLHELIEQMAANKSSTTDLLGKELVQRNECKKMFHSLLATINMGEKPCYLPRDQKDFMHPAVLFEAVKKSAIKMVNNSDAGKKDPTKAQQMEKIFETEDDTSRPNFECRICKSVHAHKIFNEKKRKALYSMVERVMNTI